MKLEGKIAIVTGGASGIGKGIVMCIAQDGADVAVVDLNALEGEKVAAEVENLGRRSFFVKTDVTKKEEAALMVKRVLDEFETIDILVNSVGAMSKRVGMPFTNNEEEDWDSMFNINLKSQFLICKEVVPHMISRRSGNIINISSISGPLSSQTNPPYSVAKAGIITFTRIMAKDLASHNINVNAICPGIIWTPFWLDLAPSISKADPEYAGLEPREVVDRWIEKLVPLKREQTPEDIGYLAAFLASNQAKNITGQAINVDGGIIMH